jgi:hypothetical protein
VKDLRIRGLVPGWTRRGPVDTARQDPPGATA